MKRCPQCWQRRPAKEFLKGKKVLANCASCRERMIAMNKARLAGDVLPALPRDPRLDTPGLRVHWMPKAKDRKLGGIPACYVSGSTCPDACGLKGAGCYAEQAFQKAHWRKLACEGGAPWHELLDRVAALAPGTLWRYAVAGDLPGDGDTLDEGLVMELARANYGHGRPRLGFGFTHKPCNSVADGVVLLRARAHGLVINLSADGLADADRKLAMRIAPVVAVVPSDTPRFFRTPGGARGVVCPAEVGDITCRECRLCANASRSSVVGFRAHGNHARRVSLKVMGDSGVRA